MQSVDPIFLLVVAVVFMLLGVIGGFAAGYWKRSHDELNWELDGDKYKRAQHDPVLLNEPIE